MIKSFEELTENKIGYGRYQNIVIFILGLIFVADGIEMSAISLIFPILKSEWKIGENLQAVIGSSLFVGFFFGSLAAGILADKIGRKRSIEYVCLVQFFLGIFSTTITNSYVFLFIRGMFGFILGYIVPLVPTLCAELIPMSKRGKVTVIINALFSVGQLFASLIAWVCLNSLSSGNWRLMLFFCSLPPIVVWYYSYKYLKESPCFVILKDDVHKGVEILNEIGRINNINFEDYKDLSEFIRWKEHVLEINNHKEEGILGNIKSLLNEYRRITLGMWTSWFGINFVFYGLVFILPFFLNELDLRANSNEGLGSLIFTTFGEGLSGVFAYLLVDSPSFGRKYSLALGQIISSLCCFVTCVISSGRMSLLIFILSVGRLTAKMCFSLIYPLTAEIYPTHLRTMGCGIASAAGRIASSIMPLIAIKLFYVNIYSPFMSFFIVGILGLLGTLILPYDTRGKYLDMKIGLNNELIQNKYNRI